MNRLPAVAIGMALCALASGAEAESKRMRLAAYDVYRPYAEGDWESAQPRQPRRSARGGKRRAAVHRSGRRQAARSGRRGRVASGGAGTIAQRGFLSFARGGTSRACLTPAAHGLLARIEAQFGSVRIVSTCRPGAVIAGSGRPSRHASGNAIDFHAPAGRKAEVVRWLIANHRAGGVMTYAAMNHIHVDIGQRFVALGAGSRHSRWR